MWNFIYHLNYLLATSKLWMTTTALLAYLNSILVEMW